MKPSRHEDSSGKAAPNSAGRRGVLLGAGAAAGAGAVALLAARGQGVAPAAPAVAMAPTDEAAGYRLSEHVRRYYETART